MTPDETAQLEVIGISLRKTFAAVAFKTMLFPLYGFCVVRACSILRRKNKTPMVWINFAIILILFLIALVLFVLDLVNFVTEITVSFIRNPDVALADRYASAEDSIFHHATVTDALYAYMTVLGDAIIIWRVYAFWGQGERRWVLLILWGMLLGSVVTNVLLTYCVARVGTQIFDGAFENPAFCRKIQTTSYTMPAATTFVATTLIGIATWEYRHTVKPYLRKVSHMTRVEKVMLLLVESGFMYFLFFFAQVIGIIPVVNSAIAKRDGLGFADLVFSFSTSIIVGWYPTLVVLLAHSQHTVVNSMVLTDLSTISAAVPEIYVSRSRMQISCEDDDSQLGVNRIASDKGSGGNKMKRDSI